LIYVVNSKTMKDIDNYTSSVIGISEEILMERAGLKVFEKIKKIIVEKGKERESIHIVIVCGCGNNAADGIVVARLLRIAGYKADIMLISDELNDMAKKQLAIAKKVGVNVEHHVEYDEYGIIVDSIFGIGLSREITGKYKEEIERINEASAIVVSVDIPSGIDANDGKIKGVAIEADYTVTFGINKQGMVLYPGCEFVGELEIADIGFPYIAIDYACNKNKKGFSSILSKEIYKEYLPIRRNNSNKGSYGRVLVIAGSKEMSGACYLSANAAYRAGAGLVKVITDEENRIILQSMLAEAIIGTYDYKDVENSEGLGKFQKQFDEDLEKSSSIVIGPGMGNNIVTKKILMYVFKNAKQPIVVDADAINVLDDELKANFPKQVIMTPHVKEMANYLNKPIEFVKDNMLDITDYMKEFIDGKEHILVLKDARTLVFDRNSRYINVSGNNGMSTGGSGDVLSGVIAAFLAEGLSCKQAGMMGVYVHGLAGDSFYNENNAYSLLAKDIIEALKSVL